MAFLLYKELKRTHRGKITRCNSWFVGLLTDCWGRGYCTVYASLC